MKEAGVIRLEGIRKRFGSRTVLDGLSLEIRKGEIFGLVGKSGCGKSTLLKVLLGIYTPDSGDIRIGTETSRNRIRKTVGYTTQENSFYEKLTVYENMYYYANLFSVKGNLRQHIEKILESVDLLKSRDTVASKISGGMKRRLDFAISLVHDPMILILDEPTTGLDPILVEQFWQVVRKNKSGERTVVVCSHIFSEIEENCDRVGIMTGGKVAKILEIPRKDSCFKLYPEFAKVVAHD